jgi:glycosyltransferase involved in cell wall biosynthesis
MSAPTRLLVLVPDRVSDILIKGEYQPNYYNPGELFDEVSLLTTTDDRPDLGALQRTVGRARLTVENLPDDPSIVAKNWRAWWRNPLEQWARRGLEVARRIRPMLMRSHGADWNTFLASRIKRATGIPYAVSLHINPDVNPPRRYVSGDLTPEQRRHNAFYDYLEREGLTHADLVMPVYEPIVPYLKRVGVKRVEVCYNILNAHHLRRKNDYSLRRPAQLLYVGRLIREKNPEQIIRAVAGLPDAVLTIVGDGPIRVDLEALVAALGVSDRVTFEPAVSNDELCCRLPGYDLFAIHTEYWELSKSLLEALLTGLPAIVNRRRGEPVPELARADIVRFVDNTAASYRDAISELMNDAAAREALGRRAYAHANAHWAPAVTEAKVVGIYRRLMRQPS